MRERAAASDVVVVSNRVTCQERRLRTAPRHVCVTLRTKKNGIRHLPQQRHAANARRVREREHRADAHKGPRRALPHPAFEPVQMARRMAPSNKPPPPKRAALEPGRSRCRRRRSPPRPRASTTADLRKLLTYDEERRGIPIRLLSARWLLTYFQAEGNGPHGSSTGSGSSASTRRRSCRVRRSSACSPSWRSARSKCTMRRSTAAFT